MNAPRRTQAERRQATIDKLVEATISILAEGGYGSTSISKICGLAELSQGALFRQFDTRLDLIAHATETIGDRHLQAFATELASAESAQRPARRMVEVIRQVCRSRNHAAWHEVIVAARTDPKLHAAVADVLARFETSILDFVRLVAPVPPSREARVATVVLSIMHMFDSEAVTVFVKPNVAIESERVSWASEVLERELAE